MSTKQSAIILQISMNQLIYGLPIKSYNKNTKCIAIITPICTLASNWKNTISKVIDSFLM